MLAGFWLFGATVIGSTLSGLTGMAGGALILAILMLFFPPLEALALHGVVQAVSNGTRIVVFWRNLRWDIIWRFTLLLLPGAFLGGICFEWFNPALLEIFLGSLLLALIWAPLPKRWERSLDRKVFLGLGFLAGFLGVMAAVVGPLLNPFFDKLNIKREAMVGTKGLCLLLLHVSRVASYSGIVGMDIFLLEKPLLIMLPAVFLGVYLAKRLNRHISDRQLDIMLKAMLTVMGARFIFLGVQALVS